MTELERLAVDAIRVLSMDAVEKAKSGHPGTPMALAPVGYVHVLADGTVELRRSDGVTNANVELEAISAFCFYNLPFDFTVAQATPRYVQALETPTARIGSSNASRLP